MNWKNKIKSRKIDNLEKTHQRKSNVKDRFYGFLGNNWINEEDKVKKAIVDQDIQKIQNNKI